MAAIMMKSALVAKPSVAVSKKTVSASLKPVSAKASVKAVAAKANSMMVWTPNDNKQFETFSFLPPLTDNQIAKQVDYIVRNGWTPCLEFANTTCAYVADTNTIRLTRGASCGYYDNRYWTMWKLPMFGCSDPSQVLREINACSKTFKDSYVRVAAFDNIRQVQICSFLVHRPSSAFEYKTPDRRSV